MKDKERVAEQFKFGFWETLDVRLAKAKASVEASKRAVAASVPADGIKEGGNHDDAS